MHAAFEELGFANEERQDIYRMLTTVLEVGNLHFVPNDATSGSSFKVRALHVHMRFEHAYELVCRRSRRWFVCRRLSVCAGCGGS